MLINGKYFQPFELIEPHKPHKPQKPFVRVENFQPLPNLNGFLYATLFETKIVNAEMNVPKNAPNSTSVKKCCPK